MKALRRLVNMLPWGVRDAMRRTPVVAPIQRWLFRRFVTGSFDHLVNAGPAAGRWFPVTLPDDKLIWTGTYELRLAEAIRRAVTTGAVCLDIGAYRGFLAGVMARAGASSVHLFEPNPSNQPRLRRLAELNADLPLRLHCLALGTRPGTAEFRLVTDATMGRLASSTFAPDTAESGRIRVQVESIDHLVSTGVLPLPDIVKVDVEGAEEEVLIGAEATFTQCRPVWFIEAHTPALAKRCGERLESHGYEVRCLETSGTVHDAHLPSVSHLVATPAVR